MVGEEEGTLGVDMDLVREGDTWLGMVECTCMYRKP